MKKSTYKALKLSKTDQTLLYCDVVRTFVTHHCACFDWQQKALGFLRARNFAALLELAESVNLDLIDSCTRETLAHTLYGSANLFKLASQFVALINKYQFTAEEIPGLDPDARALEDFLAAERRNRRLNKVFRAHLNRGSERHWCIPLIREVFCRVLGRTPPYEDIFNECDFSGGACVGLSGNATHMANKLCGESLLGSYSAFTYFREAMRRNFHYTQCLIGLVDDDGDYVFGSRPFYRSLFKALAKRTKIVGYDEIKVVPKKAKSGRTIGKNPMVNNLVQKGVDKVMRARLIKHLRLDLSDQVTNQLMSFHGSDPDTLDPYVTIDVRGASNSVLTWLVKSVTPPRWFKMFNKLRSHGYRLPGSDETRSYEMFVSMGNGFCFPLESLLFASICIAASKYAGRRPDYRVYGDDIVIRQSLALLVIECLRACGFRTNIDKTFVFGPFRESCGANWYDGRGVTPGYFKQRLTTECALHALHNSLSDYPEVQVVLRSYVHKKGRDLHVVPDEKRFDWVTDQAFIVPHDVAMSCKNVRYDRAVQNFAYPILITSPVSDEDWTRGGNLPAEVVESLRVAAVLRGSSAEKPFHLRRTVKYRSAMTNSAAAAEMHRLIKRLSAKEGIVTPRG